jgi:DnaJ-domain-containing protein 1
MVRESSGSFPGNDSLYAVLQVSPDACPEVIQAAYRVLARAYHPDVSTVVDAERRTRQLNAAYDVLGDPGRRADYDASLAEWARNGAQRHRPPAPGPIARAPAEERARSYERGTAPLLVAWIVTATVATTIIVAMLLVLWSLYDALDDPGSHTVLSGTGSIAPLQAPFSAPAPVMNGNQPR